MIDLEIPISHAMRLASRYGQKLRCKKTVRFGREEIVLHIGMFGATIPARDIQGCATTSEISCILIEQCRALLEANAELQRTVIDVTWEKPNEKLDSHLPAQSR